MTGTLCIRLLGAFGLSCDGAQFLPPAWPHQKAATLLKIIACQPERSMHRARLMEMLWPQADGPNNLHKSIHYLRALLPEQVPGDEFLRLDRNHLSLAPGVRIDAEDFIRQSEAALSASQPADVQAAGLRTALSAYAGDMLPDDPLAEWAAPARDRVYGRWRRIVLELARLERGHEKADGALPMLEALAQRDPSDEEAQAALMQSLAASGDRRAALRQYESFKRAADDMAITPGDEIQSLRDRVARGEGVQLTGDAAARDWQQAVTDAFLGDPERD